MTIIVSKGRRQRGFSLVEAAIAIVIITITALGSLAYQYLGEKHLKMARADFTATRVGQMVIEDWKSVGGAAGYDPTAINTALDVSLGLRFTGAWPNYVITVDGITLYISLATNSPVAPDPYAGVLRQITATIRWRSDFGTGAPGASDPILVFTTYSR